MSSPLIRSLVNMHGFAEINEEELDAFLAAHEYTVLFFPGDAERLVESDDVAVILPELMKVFGDVLTPALVAKSAERILQRRYRFNAFPALVFLRRGGYLGVITRMQDWDEYLRQIADILRREPTTPPPFEFPEGCRIAGMRDTTPRHANSGEQQ